MTTLMQFNKNGHVQYEQSNALNSTLNLGVYSLFQRIQHQRTEIGRM